MTDQPLLSATLIARNEKHNIKRCFDSIWDHVDEIVLVDTGSKDGTVQAARSYATKRKQPGKLKIGKFKWRDDFAAARQAADDLATGQWLVWMDMDDTIQGLEHARGMLRNAPDQILAYYAIYTYAQDADGNPISELWRERLVRRGAMDWKDRLHEHKLLPPGHPIIRIPADQMRWVHHRDHTQRTSERNLGILEQWAKDEPDSPRVLQSLGMEYMGDGRWKDASDTFARYLAIPGEPPDRRSQACRHMCVMLGYQERYPESRVAAFQLLAEHWLSADTHLSLAEAEQALGRPDVALQHAKQALELGQPDTLLIVNPMQYRAHPLAIMAVCYAQMGRWQEAVSFGEQTLQVSPTNALVGSLMPQWRGQLKKFHTLETVLALADVEVETGELVKAARLLNDAPYFVSDDPRLVDRKAQLAQLIRHRREHPEELVDEAADLFITRHLEAA